MFIPESKTKSIINDNQKNKQKKHFPLLHVNNERCF